MNKNTRIAVVLFAILYLLFGSLPSYAQETSFGELNCNRYKAEIWINDSIRLIHDDTVQSMNGKIVESVDLNFDGLDDLIINFGKFPQRDDCVFGIYVQLSNGDYQCVFPPEYWNADKWRVLEHSVTVTERMRWKDIELYSRGNVGGRPGIVPRAYLQYTDDNYRQWKLASMTEGLRGGSPRAFEVIEEFEKDGTLYRLERLLLKDWKLGPLMLSVYVRDSLNYYQVSRRNVIAPESENIEIDEVNVIRLKRRPFFFVKARYSLYLIDLQNEWISLPIRPGIGVDYGEDAISGVMNGFQFFDDDNYLIGIAVSYGLFCFNISDLANPTELHRYSANFSNRGQPYFFLEQQKDFRWKGIVARSDTTKKSSHISNFYTETKKATYLFQNAALLTPTQNYTDPAVDFDPKSFLELTEKLPNGRTKSWIVNLRKGELLKDRSAQKFLQKVK